MRRSVVIVLLLLAAGCASAPPPEPRHAAAHAHKRRLLAGPMQPHARPTVRLSVDDVLGQPVRLGPPGQKGVTVVFLMSRDTRDESSELGRAVDERLVAEPIEQVSIVDVHRYGGAMRSMALWQMRKSAKQALDRRKKRREERHVDASDAAVRRWHLVGDFDGALLKQFGVGRDLQHPAAFVVTPDGEARGPYQDAAGVAAAVERVREKNARHGDAARALSSTTASR